MALMVLDMAIQVHGAAGVSSDTVLAHLWAAARTLRIADGPDEVHLGTIGKLELEIQRAKLWEQIECHQIKAHEGEFTTPLIKCFEEKTYAISQ